MIKMLKEGEAESHLRTPMGDGASVTDAKGGGGVSLCVGWGGETAKMGGGRRRVAVHAPQRENISPGPRGGGESRDTEKTRKEEHKERKNSAGGRSWRTI